MCQRSHGHDYSMPPTSGCNSNSGKDSRLDTPHKCLMPIAHHYIIINAQHAEQSHLIPAERV